MTGGAHFKEDAYERTHLGSARLKRQFADAPAASRTFVSLHPRR
jgi:hypothetical protein